MNRLNYFYLPNSVFDYGLSANEIGVLAVLYASARNNIVQISQKTIAEKLGIKKEETVSRCIRRLCGCGFILSSERPVTGLYRRGTTIYYLCPKHAHSSSHGYFRVVREVVLRRVLKPSHLRVYLFVCKAISSKTGSMWNSYSDMAEILKSTRSAVIKIIADLVCLKLIRKVMVKNKLGAYSDNHYSLRALPVKIRTNKATIHTYFALQQVYDTAVAKESQGCGWMKFGEYEYSINIRGST